MMKYPNPLFNSFSFRPEQAIAREGATQNLSFEWLHLEF